jgi:hypothetical protein
MAAAASTINPAPSVVGVKLSKKEQVKQNKALLKAVENEDIAALEASISAGADVNYGHPEVVGEGDG